MNIKLIKKTGLLKKARKRCASRRMLLPDQSALNKVAVSKLIIDTKYNDQHKVCPDTIFRHFSTTFILFPRIKTKENSLLFANNIIFDKLLYMVNNLTTIRLRRTKWTKM